MAGFVLNHGGCHRGGHWARLLPYLTAPAVALDLPGRSSPRADVRALTPEDFVRSAVADVRATGWDHVTIVGHSLAGAVVPEVVARLAPLVREVVYVSCVVPPVGGSLADVLPPALKAYVRCRARRGTVALSPLMARFILCNGMASAQRSFVVDQLCAEPSSIFLSALTAQAWPDELRRTYVLLTRDRALPPWVQRRQIANFGQCEVAALDAPHDAFVSHGPQLAEILNHHLPER